jgi:hypothetical protein
MTAATITVTGRGVASAVPDEGIWTVELDALDQSADEALAAVAARTKELDAVLDELEIARERRSTIGVTVREEVEYEQGRRIHRGYRAQNIVTVRLTAPLSPGASSRMRSLEPKRRSGVRHGGLPSRIPLGLRRVPMRSSMRAGRPRRTRTLSVWRSRT